MAVEVEKKDTKVVTSSSAGSSAGRRLRVGGNVILASVFAVAIAAILQALAYSMPTRWDMTSSGVNSLSPATENLLQSLDSNIRLTSLYFETDREEEDQSRYRTAAGNLLDLYEATNRAKIASASVNPLKDHESFQKCLTRLREKPAFREQIEEHKARIDRYLDELDTQMRTLVQSETDRIASMGGAIGDSSALAAVTPVEQLFARWSGMLDGTRERIDALTFADNPQYSAAIAELRNLYRDFGKALKDIVQFGPEQIRRNPGLPAEQVEFLQQTGSRYADLLAEVEKETTKLQELGPLDFDDLLAKLAPTSNAILLETEDDAMVLDFASVWPPLDERGGGRRADFSNRAFKGEEKLTSAILRVTHKEQTAVVFVRYGGPQPFMGGFMPGQPPAPYSAMKERLEDVNFVVHDWDLKTSETPPKIDPEPTRVIYVVFKPTAPPRGPMGRQSPDPPFGPNHRKAVLDAVTGSGRALFIAGWHPGPFGPIPSTYEFNDHLKDEWGVSVDTSALLIETMNIAPGKYVVGRRDFFNMREMAVTEHDIVSGALARQLTFPACAPLELSDTPPEGVVLEKLVEMPERDGVWGVKNLMKYNEQLQGREYMTREEGDLEGPFTLAVAATKGEEKLVVISSRDFANDSVAFARVMALTAQGLTIRTQNPGNVSLLINSLHWLNDSTEFMNIGKPIEAAVLEIPSESTVRTVKVLTIFAWPMLALVCGCVAWWVRRR